MTNLFIMMLKEPNHDFIEFSAARIMEKLHRKELFTVALNLHHQ
jgi:hypothetical protein